jgi:hypothetical protein
VLLFLKADLLLAGKKPLVTGRILDGAGKDPDVRLEPLGLCEKNPGELR